jgi:hypothetical protein
MLSRSEKLISDSAATIQNSVSRPNQMTKLTYQSHKLLIGRYISISQLFFLDPVRRFDAIQGSLG